MAREEANEAFAQTSFLYGANAAYIEELYAQFQSDRNSVSPEWQDFFGSMPEDAPADVIKNAVGASWKKAHWPIPENGELISAMDGNWGPVGDEPLDSGALGNKIKATAAGATLSDADIQMAAKDSILSLIHI